MSTATRRHFLALLASAAAGLRGAALGQGAGSRPWKFGVISDTQWAPAEGRPGKGVATEIIDNLNLQFIKHGVEFVIAVGDVTDRGGKDPSELDIRAAHAQALRDAGIGFFPLRGNHEGSLEAAKRWPKAFPGLPGTRGFHSKGGVIDGGSPHLAGLAGCSYAFTHENAAFVLLDQFTVDNGTEPGVEHPIAVQQPWVTARLEAASDAGMHAFVFAHKNLLGQNHKDNLFGDPVSDDDPGDRAPEASAAASAFVEAMNANGARYYICGHDHTYHRSLVASPEKPSIHAVEQVITGSDSYKFYTPHPPYSGNETPIAQQRRAVGYVIVTVDGPLVQVDFHGVVMPGEGSLTEWPPRYDWPLMDRFGYGQNGKRFVVRGGEGLRRISDRAPAGRGYAGSVARILGGVCEQPQIIVEEDPADNRHCVNVVNTGWTPRPRAALSDAFHLWGLRVGLGSPRTSEFALGMSHQATNAEEGAVALLSRDESGRLVNAVALNEGGIPRFVSGPYSPGYALGAYGVDPRDGVAWAVVNHDGEFVVGRT